MLLYTVLACGSTSIPLGPAVAEPPELNRSVDEEDEEEEEDTAAVDVVEDELDSGESQEEAEDTSPQEDEEPCLLALDRESLFLTSSTRTDVVHYAECVASIGTACQPPFEPTWPVEDEPLTIRISAPENYGEPAEGTCTIGSTSGETAYVSVGYRP